MTLLEMCASLIFGGGVYIIIEILYRGYSHWSMAIAGGVSFLLLHGLFSKFSGHAHDFKTRCMLNYN